MRITILKALRSCTKILLTSVVTTSRKAGVTDSLPLEQERVATHLAA